MHNLAIALKEKGYQVSGSDDDIFEPSRTRLATAGLLPSHMGWDVNRITADLDAIIVGMHAHADNPEVQRALSLGLPVRSFPEYLYEHARNKQRIVVTGSHGKTTVTSMMIHVLTYWKRTFDYAVGAKPQGVDTTVRLSQHAPMILLEGDEYPSSRLDSTPKCLHYKHHLGIVTGVAWDHINIYTSFDDYCLQFRRFIEQSVKAGVLVYNETDPILAKMVKEASLRDDVTLIPYKMQKYQVKNGVTYLLDDDKNRVPVHFFGEHNMLNVSAAIHACARLGVSKKEFYEAIQSFQGTARRMEKLGENDKMVIYQDFAHAPSKLKATTHAVKQQYPKRRLTACMELHTYSSLNQDFIGQYRGTMNGADEALVYFNPKTVALKKLTPLSQESLLNAFQHPNMKIFSDSQALEDYLLAKQWDNENLLLMSSGNFNNLDLRKISEQILHHYA